MIADRRTLLRQGLRRALADERDFCVTGEIDRCAHLEQAHRAACDLVLLDERLASCEQITALAALVPIVVLASVGDGVSALAAVRAGARGVVLYEATLAELTAAIRLCARGEVSMPPAVQAALVRGVQAPRGAQLTPRELEVLEGAARGRTNPEIATALFISEDTVKKHMSHILAKLQVRDRVALTLYALRHGLVLLSELTGTTVE